MTAMMQIGRFVRMCRQTPMRALAAMLCAQFASGTALSQSYPSRPVTMIVPVTAGSAQDFIGRQLGPMLGQRLGQPFIIDNRVGASGVIGATALAKAAPDGHTIMLGAIVFTTAPALRTSLPYDPVADFAPIGPVAKAPMALGINPNVQATNINEFVALVRSRPGKLNYGSPGTGTPHHLFMELFRLQEKIDIVHVPYKELGGMVNDVIGGTLEAGFFTVFQGMSLSRGGKVRVLAVVGKERSSIAPDVPTFRERNIDGMDPEIWIGFMAPGRTPPEIITRLNTEVNALLGLPAVQESFGKLGLVPFPGTAAELGTIMKNDLERWARVVREAGIKPD
ncbi:MAG: Bug family tripartite tricarboxylate transporter substrate binding protein [Burkholderiales bacterium]